MRGRSFVLMVFACAVALAFAVGHKADKGLLPEDESFQNWFKYITLETGLIAGVLILAMPRLLNYIVAIYLILVGLLELFGHSAHL